MAATEFKRLGGILYRCEGEHYTQIIEKGRATFTPGTRVKDGKPYAPTPLPAPEAPHTEAEETAAELIASVLNGRTILKKVEGPYIKGTPYEPRKPIIPVEVEAAELIAEELGRRRPRK